MHRLSALLALGALVAVGGCAEEEKVIVEPTPWAAVSTGFGDGFFDPAVREALFSASARGDLILSDQITAGRYRLLSLAELRRVDDTRRIGEVAFTVDGWPASLEIELMRGDDGGWRVDAVGSPDEQQRLLDLLGPRGLPIVREADPWAGGLAGRDAAGRPTAAVLIKVHDERAYVDGGEALPIREAPVKAALAVAIKTRRELADDAHATYRPHVALALPRAASSALHAKLSKWAVDAGAEALQLVVRSQEGTPAWLPLARRVVAEPGAPTNAWTITRGARRMIVDAGGERAEVPDQGGIDAEGLAAALTRLEGEAGKPDGVVFVAHGELDHGALIQLHLAARKALPGVALTGEVAR